MHSLKGSQLGTFCPEAVMYCYLEFKLRYPKNLKLFSMRVKSLFLAYSLRRKKEEKKKEKKRTTGFCSF